MVATDRLLTQACPAVWTGQRAFNCVSQAAQSWNIIILQCIF
jgi:hypothetical protein